MTDYFELAQAICAPTADDRLNAPPGTPREMLASVSRLLRDISDRFQLQEDRGDMTMEAEVLWSRCVALHHRIGEALVRP